MLIKVDGVKRSPLTTQLLLNRIRKLEKWDGIETLSQLLDCTVKITPDRIVSAQNHVVLAGQNKLISPENLWNAI